MLLVYCDTCAHPMGTSLAIDAALVEAAVSDIDRILSGAWVQTSKTRVLVRSLWLRSAAFATLTEAMAHYASALLANLPQNGGSVSQLVNDRLIIRQSGGEVGLHRDGESWAVYDRDLAATGWLPLSDNGGLRMECPTCMHISTVYRSPGNGLCFSPLLRHGSARADDLVQTYVVHVVSSHARAKLTGSVSERQVKRLIRDDVVEGSRLRGRGYPVLANPRNMLNTELLAIALK